MISCVQPSDGFVACAWEARIKKKSRLSTKLNVLFMKRDFLTQSFGGKKNNFKKKLHRELRSQMSINVNVVQIFVRNEYEERPEYTRKNHGNHASAAVRYLKVTDYISYFILLTCGYVIVFYLPVFL
uniref:Uncharacterized protein n=1 Tax=Glossina brevipalpis TaxID=37001 RepID=A0A1A9W378_9MUSC